MVRAALTKSTISAETLIVAYDVSLGPGACLWINVLCTGRKELQNVVLERERCSYELLPAEGIQCGLLPPEPTLGLYRWFFFFFFNVVHKGSL